MEEKVRSSIGGIGIRALVATLLVAVGSAACGDGPASPNTAGRLAIHLTDSPAQDISSVNVYIDGLKIKLADQPEQRFAVDVGLVDLLTLQNSAVLLSEAAVEAGEYEYVMVELDQERSSVVVDSVQLPVKIPSEKVKVFGPFEVTEDGFTTLTLDFDAAGSLMQLGNGDWLMTPIIILLHVEAS